MLNKGLKRVFQSAEKQQQVIKNIPYERFGHVDKLTEAIIWLLSDASAFVSGTVINVDGGFSIFSGV